MQNYSADYFADKNASASTGQAQEIRGWLVMCPDPPCDAWNAAMRRGDKQTKLEDSGRGFSAGTFRVGNEVKPGTYAVQGGIEYCYWDTQARSRHTIDNYFTASARRVE